MKRRIFLASSAGLMASVIVRPVSALTQLKADLENEMSDTIKVFEIYIKAPAQKVWDAITTPEWTARYGYKAHSEYDLRPGGAFRAVANEQMRSFGLPETIIDGEVIEVDPPHKLVHTYRFLFNDDNRAEGFTRIGFAGVILTLIGVVIKNHGPVS